ncbi:MAG: hypothetical protein VCA73_01030 [Roseibacillus sp.]|jgi:hypothetical protein
MSRNFCFLTFILAQATFAVPEHGPESPADFDRLHALIKPQPGESPWREINWLTNVTEARKRSIAENKPIVIFTAADGSPLGRT